MRHSLENLKDRKDLIGAEIGVQRGLNALNMLEHLDLKKLYLIDPYVVFPNASGSPNIGCTQEEHDKIFEQAKRNLEKFSTKIVWIKKFSWDASNEIPDGELDFVYIDGDHRTEIVKKDIELYRNKVKKGGIIAGHDLGEDYVRKGVDQMYSVYKQRGDDWWVIKE